MDILRHRLRSVWDCQVRIRLYRWKREQLDESGPVASALDARVSELEAELRRVERERDILKKALAIFSRSE